MTEAETSWQADDTSVRVALRIRPQSAKEKIDMCRVCTSVTPGEPQVMMGNDKSFTYDYVFDIESTQEVIYNDIARALVDGCFHGYNATIFAYGQTGSGKTYTMGTGFDVEQDDFTVGIIPRAVSHLFNGINERKKAALSVNEPAPDFKVNAQFMELYNEEIIDLLDTTKDPSEKGKYKSHIKIHEDAEGGIYTVGVTTRPVQSLEDTMQCLKMGALSRTTASTNMNTASSRSHAIFTLHIKQQRIVNTEEDDTSSTTSETQTFEFETLTAKFHFVDLAGSERLKRTGAIGERAKEGISINCGLLALGNVISALGDKAKKGSHVPYRDSKLTRLLQDSLGGNSRTLMIACISPSDRDFMETLNTLKYANRARNIKNKVSVNQDKTSRQIAALRQQVQTLMDELADYKQGKRLVDADGVETVNDMFHENTMLQSEIQSLRTRVKALQDTVDCLKQQLTDKELAMVTAITGEGGEEVAKLVEGYVNEIQTLRAKLMETEATLRRSSPRVPSRATMSPMTAPMISNYDLNVSNSTEDAGLSTILSAAKKDVRKLKKERKRLVSHGSDKENETEGQGNVSEEEKQDTEKQEQETEHKAEDESDEEGHVEEVEDGDLSSETDSEDSENIHEDLATITCEISIKETLIEELEKSQRRLHSLKTHYEEKLLSLQARIKETELERDKVLNNIGSMESTSQGDKKKMKDQYEKKLNDMKSELKKLNAAKKEHNKLMRNQSQYEQQLKTLQRDLSEMKKVKVKLMNKMKDEAQKNRQAELKKNKEIAQLRKVQRTKEHTIKTLEAEKRQKEVVLRRKQEEVELLRKRQKPMSAKTAGRVATYKPETSLYGRRKKKEFSPKAAKQKWDSLNKAVSSLVTKKQTLVHMEKDMERWMKDREKKGKRLDKLMQKRERTLLEENNEAQIKDVTDQISTLKASIDFAQDNITECQTNIMQLEEETKEEESFSQLTVDGLEEAKYLLEHFMNLAIGKGMLAAQKDTENRELVAQMEQEKLELMFNRDMLHYLIKDQVDIDIDLPDFGAHRDDEYELQSGASSSSTSPIDSRLENQFQPINASLLLAPPGGGEAPAFSRKDKARRKTATPEDLLYANSGPSEGGPPLLPVVELPGEREMMYDDDDTMSVDSLMMPPPRIPPSLLLKQNGILRPTTGGSSATSPGPSPALGGRKFPGRTMATVEKKKSQTSTSSTSSTEHMGSRANSIDDQTPPTSPMTTRRIRDENVFSRLTSNSQPSSPSPNRGSINATSKPSITRTSPLTCTHLAEGHTKAILSVYATDDLLFSSSKDRTAKVWDLETGEEVLSLTGHPNNVTAVRYSEASHLIYTVSTYFVKVWDIRDTKRSIKTLSSSGLSSDGTPHETSSRQIDCPPGETIINDIAVNSTGTVAYTAAGNSVRIWDIRSTKAVGRLSGGRQSAVMVIAVDDTDTADGNICVVTGSKDHYIKIFEMSEDTVGILSPKYNLEPPHYDGIQSLCLMGDLLFSGSRDMCIKKWDLSEHELSKSINNAHNNWVTGLTFAPGGDCLLSGCRGGYLKLWNIDTCACLGEIKAHNSPINSIATNRRSVFTASNDNTIGIWQTQGMIDDGGCGD